ncbi:lyase [Streptomyces longisporoflavus]|uniref:VOC family protein n=1 Tax=Streptomyces longisporoflavus TaxID=28044 RepID=UPI00167CE8F3|nr:VOC family protein [Streptomyces longisporoflavus]GGV27486.1 lyase [Streptomyces longisporoflavus]
MTGTELELAACALAVHDLDAAADFYRDALGFEVHDDAVRQGVRRVAVRSPAQPVVRIVLETPDADPALLPSDRQAIESLMARGLLNRLVFATSDCDAVFERIEATGAEVMQEPINRADGVRDCVFLDPSGNMLRFTQRLRPGAPGR